MVSAVLRGAKNITDEEAEALEDIMNAAFRYLTKGKK